MAGNKPTEVEVNVVGTRVAPESGSGANANGGEAGASANNQIIPGNTRQDLLPFYIDPASPYNQVFSFRNKDKSGCKLNIIPEDRNEFDKDVGIRFLVSQVSKSGATKDTILDHIPAIQIREYTQDTKLELLFGLLKNAIRGFNDGSGKGNQDSSAFDQTKNMVGSAAKQLTFFAEYVAEKIQSQGWWDGLMTSIGSWFKSSCEDIGIPEGGSDDVEKRISLAIRAVYCLYYRMIGATTTNRYVLPYNGTEVFATSGTDGWGAANGFGGTTSKNSIFGKLFNFALGSNLRIVTQPIWGGSSGGGSGGVSMTLSLYNDTMEHAINNFIFVNTICPSNMFLQYGIWQLPPSVYDIKIEGGRRWFMCTGTTSCQGKGVMRDVSQKFIDELVDKHGNSIVKSGNNKQSFSTNRLVKIPDVYELTLQFTSLLPDNFNQCLFQYMGNNNITTIKQPRQEGWYTDGSPAYSYIQNTLDEAKKYAEKEAPKASTQADAANQGKQDSNAGNAS